MAENKIDETAAKVEKTTPEKKTTKVAEVAPAETKEPVVESTLGAAKVEKALSVDPQPKIEPPVAAPIAVRPELDPTKSHEERILSFLDSHKTGDFVKMNDFLKSLYPLAKPGIPPLFTDQRTMKQLKHLLLKLQSENKIVFPNNHFERLGKHYYDGNDVEQKTRYYNILNVPVEAKITQ